MAKELSMVENNEQGKAARKYFIECEKKLVGSHKQVSLNDPHQLRSMLLSYTEQVIELQQNVLLLETKVEVQKPAVEFVEKYVDKGFNVCLSDAWKSLGLKPILFNTKLVNDGVLFRRGTSNKLHAMQHHINDGHFVEVVTNYGTQTLVTPKGVIYISQKYKTKVKPTTNIMDWNAYE